MGEKLLATPDSLQPATGSAEVGGLILPDATKRMPPPSTFTVVTKFGGLQEVPFTELWSCLPDASSFQPHETTETAATNY